ncbi:MAG: NUDIX domain-containing protein [Pseudomonadota bacterium]|nr:NUDIX domain-containing protein [Pseudomonadota bacterium]
MPPDPVSPSPAPTVPELIPSATVLVARDGPDGIQVLAVVRSQGVSFAPGALAFPGGVVDPGDWTLAQGLGQGRAQEGEIEPYRLAAIRELFEETGLLLAEGVELMDGEHLARCREPLLRGELDFAGLLADLGLRPALDSLAHVAHWITPRSFPRRFTTHFFLAPAPPGQEPRHEAGELTAAFWMNPGEAIEWHRSGRHRLMLPTLHSCGRLARFATVAEAMAGMGFEFRPAPD